MEYLNEISKNSSAALYRYVIKSIDEKVLIKYTKIFDTDQGTTFPDEEMNIIQMHIANIPDLVNGIFKVFQSNDQVVWTTDKDVHGDSLSAYMADNERYFLGIAISDHSGRVPQAFSNQIEFEFENGGILINTPIPRVPTPSMIWVTDTLKQIYDDWKNGQNGGQGAQV
jgi:hypothetical protein